MRRAGLWVILMCLGPGLAFAAAAETSRPPRRIVSLAPSLTETLFALGAGDAVVGRTEFCRFPPAALALPDVGGLYDPNYEAVLALKPDLVVLLPENRDQREKLAALGLPALTVEQNTLAGVADSFLRLGSLTGHPAEGARLAADLRDACAQARVRTAARPRSKVLLVMSRDYDPGPVREIYGAGRGGIYDQILDAAGGRNVLPASLPSYPKLSGEGVLALAPDVILDLVPGEIAARIPEAELVQSWRALPGFGARRVVILSGDFLTIPGPRLLQTLEVFLRALHPDLAPPVRP